MGPSLFLKEKRLNELLAVLGLLCLSGNRALSLFYDELLISFAMIITFLCWHQGKRLMSHKLSIIVYIYLVIITIQSLQFSFFPFVSYSGFFIRFFAAYLVVVFVKDFMKTYTRVMFFLTFLSLLFQLPVWLGMGIPSFAYILNRPFGYEVEVGQLSIFFHTYLIGILGQSINRNSGMFAEPGLFAGYLNLAILFLGITREEISKKEYKASFILLLIGLFSTMATQGYIVLPFALFFHFNWKYLNTSYWKSLLSQKKIPIVIICFILLGGYAYREVPFMKEKIVGQYYSVKYEERGWEKLRYAGFVISWEYIKQKPIVGWGFHPSTRYTLTPQYAKTGIGTTGMTDYIAKVGMLGFVTYVLSALSSFYNILKKDKLKITIFFFFLLLIIQGEPFLGFPFFFSLMFLKNRAENHQQEKSTPLL